MSFPASTTGDFFSCSPAQRAALAVDHGQPGSGLAVHGLVLALARAVRQITGPTTAESERERPGVVGEEWSV
ncbi:hypothetical protein [Streptomyces sp. NPDC058011]|uniref:hypothetical protein n=1 Tax=Streptomyces sp. NPDC058011 TaxID=3346305 RepID=UPI0036E75C4C